MLALCLDRRFLQYPPQTFALCRNPKPSQRSLKTPALIQKPGQVRVWMLSLTGVGPMTWQRGYEAEVLALLCGSQASSRAKASQNSL